MQYLLSEIVVFLILAYALGLFTGWALWHRATPADADPELKRKLADSQSTVRNLQRKVDTLQAQPTHHAPIPTSAEPEEALDADPAPEASVPDESGPRPMSVMSGPAAAAFLDDAEPPPPAPPPAPLPESAPAETEHENADADPALGSDTPGPTYDDLQRISGIGPIIERQLAELGVTTYRQIARFADGDIERVGRHLDVFPDRVRRERWVEQAAMLHRETYGTTP